MKLSDGLTEIILGLIVFGFGAIVFAFVASGDTLPRLYVGLGGAAVLGLGVLLAIWENKRNK